MKVAVCISGQMRCYEQCFDSLKYFILDQFDCNIFIHTWKNRGISFNGNGSYVNQNDEISLEGLSELYNPKVVVIEEYNDFKVLDKYQYVKDTIDPVYPTFPMFYSQKCCNDLKNKYSSENNVDYDLVIRMRADIQIESFIPSYVKDELTTFWHQNHPDFVWWRTFDHFHISNTENMNIYCNAYDYMDDLWNTPLENCDAEKHDGRRLQTINMKKHNIIVKPFEDYIYKIQRHNLGI